jgi:hypothetical protein
MIREHCEMLYVVDHDENSREVYEGRSQK